MQASSIVGFVAIVFSSRPAQNWFSASVWSQASLIICIKCGSKFSLEQGLLDNGLSARFKLRLLKKGVGALLYIKFGAILVLEII